MNLINNHKTAWIAKVIMFLVFSFSFYSRIVIAQTDNNAVQIPFEKTNPDSTIGYSLKRIVEKLTIVKINLFSKNQKVKYMTKLANRRVSELFYIVDNKKVHYLEKSSSRYISQLGLISEELQTDKSDASFVKSNLETHVKILEAVKDRFPAQTSHWLLVQQAMETSKVTFSKVSELTK